jgi:hypothetical protein
MATEKYAGTDLYVDASDRADVVEVLRSRWGLEPSFGTFTLARFSVDVGKHKGYDRDAAPDDFLGWHTLVGITADTETPDDAVVRFVADLMQFLEAAGFPSAAACRFEDELALLEDHDGE